MTTKKVTAKFKDFTPMEKKIFCLYQAERLSRILDGLEVIWKSQLKRFGDKKAPADEKKAPVDEKSKTSITEDEFKRVANKDDVNKYVASLTELQKKHAVRFENLMDEIFEKFKDGSEVGICMGSQPCIDACKFIRL